MPETDVLPERYWHCYVTMADDTKGPTSVVNDLTLGELRRLIVEPWHRGVQFPVAGVVVRNRDMVREIRIAQTPQSKQVYTDEHYARNRAAGIVDLATNPSMLPFSKGRDFTHELLFQDLPASIAEPDVELVMQLCRRLPATARVLANRDRKKPPFEIEDEYDVQDLLHSVLRAFLKSAVVEEPLGKVGAVRSGRADLAIEDLGTIVEVKYARGPRDQVRLVEEFAQDVQLYVKWPHLQYFIYYVYNSGDLRDPEALERLSGDREVEGKRFRVFVILA